MPVASGLYYFAHEAEDLSRPPVILIHGAGGHHLFWPPQIRRMPNQRILAVDLPGHGKSGGIGHHTIDDYTREIIGFIKALKLNAAVLAGHSMGGAVALKAAIRFPRRVLGLCLVGSGARLPVTPALLQSSSNPSTFESAVHLIVDESFSPQADVRLKELAAERMAETRPSVLYGDLLACNEFNVTDQLQKVSTPTYILCGSLDKMAPLNYSEYLQSHIAGAQLDILPAAGHMLMLEQPQQIADKLGGFINRLSYKPGQ